MSSARILEGPVVYLNSGSTLELTCLVNDTPGSPDYIFWHHNGEVSITVNARVTQRIHRLSQCMHAANHHFHFLATLGKIDSFSRITCSLFLEVTSKLASLEFLGQDFFFHSSSSCSTALDPLTSLFILFRDLHVLYHPL